jgi:enoyl-CoA hydratase/carnithine racemase
MADDSPRIVTELHDGIAVLRFNKPAKRNPLSISTLQDLEIKFSQLVVLPEINVIVFTGTADVFASGADLREISRLDHTSALEFSHLGQQVFQTISNAKQLTIAAINGYCMGGALDLALACDIRVASKSAVFSHPGARLGIMTGWGGTERLPRIIGRAWAMELFATGRRLDSEEARSIGLVTRVEDPILGCAFDISHAYQIQVPPNR